jgi:surface antigen
MRILEVCEKYKDQFELPGNAGFKNADFQAKLEADGWQKYQAWCCYCAEMCFEEAYPEIEKELDRLFSANCVQTFHNFEAAGYATSTLPVLGALMIMQKYVDGKPTTQGHAGIVTQVLSNSTWVSFEGNTNSAGSREGDSTQYKTRSLMYHPTGLRVLGFVKIPK